MTNIETISAIVVSASVLSSLLSHALLRRYLLAAAEQKSLALACKACGLKVVRFDQLPDSTIRCVNCRPKKR